MANDAVFRELWKAFADDLRWATNLKRLRKVQREFRKRVRKTLTEAGFCPGDVRDLEALLAGLFTRECALTAHRVRDAFESDHLSGVFEKLLHLKENPLNWRWLWDYGDSTRGETGRAIRDALYRKDSARALFLIECA